MAGVGAFRTAFQQKIVAVGPQDLVIGATRIWVLPNPSGLNARGTIPLLAAALADLREAVESERG